MNTKSLFAAATLLACALVTPPAEAGITDYLGTWEGSGTAMDVTGKDLGPFTISLTRKGESATKVHTDGTVKLVNGQVITFWQDIEDHGPNGFHIVSNNGTGGGHCFANGMCQTYEQRPDGHAFATTIARDGTDHLRILVTELDHGNAVRFFQQSLAHK